MRIYRGILWLSTPVVLLWLLWRRLAGRDSGRALAERLGYGRHGPEAHRLWIHGASNGELASARWLVTALISKSPGLHLIVTCNTETGRALVQDWALPRVEAALAPLDLSGPLRRFLDRWHPRALLLLESELWPNRIATCAEHGLPVLLFGARLSAKSAATWRRFRRLRAAVFSAIRFLSAQDAGSEARFRALGVPGGRIGPVVNLKAHASPAPRVGELLLPAKLRTAFHAATTCLAASTHEGEDAIVLQAFANARAEGGPLTLILAPRHPRRRAEIEAQIRAAGLTFATRSAGQDPNGVAVYLADTMGEMELWYRLAGTTFVGGSLVAAGGHTPYEPARFGSAVVHGPEVANFAEAYAELDRAGGALQVHDAKSLATALVVLADPVRRAGMAARAQEVLAAPTGGEAALCDALAEALDLAELRA